MTMINDYDNISFKCVDVEFVAFDVDNDDKVRCALSVYYTHIDENDKHHTIAFVTEENYGQLTSNLVFDATATQSESVMVALEWFEDARECDTQKYQEYLEFVRNTSSVDALELDVVEDLLALLGSIETSNEINSRIRVHLKDVLRQSIIVKTADGEFLNVCKNEELNKDSQKRFLMNADDIQSQIDMLA